MQTSVIIAIILGVLLFTAIVAIIVIVIVGKKDLKKDLETLIKYGLELQVQQAPGGTVDPGEAALLASINYDCIVGTIDDNYNTEQQITILGVFSTIINVQLDIARSYGRVVNLPQNVKDILKVYSLDIKEQTMLNLLLQGCDCVPGCKNNATMKAMITKFVENMYKGARKYIDEDNFAKSIPERYTRERYGCGNNKHNGKRA